MRKCGNCINGCYNYVNDTEEFLCGIDRYNEKKVNEADVCEYHNYIPSEKKEDNVLVFDGGGKFGNTGLVLLHRIDDRIDKICRIYKCEDSYSKYFRFETISNCVDRSYMFTFRSVDDDENGLFYAFAEFYKRIKELKQTKISVSSNRLVVTVNFPDLLMISSQEDPILYEIIESLYDDLETQCVAELSDENMSLKLT